jgi:hypothetical protein
MGKRVFAITVALAALLVLSVVGHAQAPQSASEPNTPEPSAQEPNTSEPSISKPAKASKSQSKSEKFTVAGYPGQASIFQLNDKSYVEIEQLARLTNASLTFRADQIILTLSATPTQLTEEPKPKPGFSKAFLRASIEQMGVIREWRSGLANAIQNSYPLGEDWFSAQRRNADKSLALVSTAMSTDDDRNAFPLLSAELNDMQKLSDNYLAMRQNAEYIPPDSLDSDSVDQQILSCSRGIAAMFSENKFQDVADCH